MSDEAQRKSGSASVSAPDLEWLDGDVPRAEGFDDTYFSKAGGLAETRHVFLSGNGLPERFQDRKRFSIAELGFGTGLNFLATREALSRVIDPPRLTFISFELYPMTAGQLARALAAFPEVAGVAKDLIATWAPREGWNRLTFGDDLLLLGVGDARTLIGQLTATSSEVTDEPQLVDPVDAWFLDGFSPAKNPELWDVDLLCAAAALTTPNGTLATYTSAGWVRRNLQAAGFSVQKTKGFAGKREMVVGRKEC